jgi:peroxiredoxin
MIVGVFGLGYVVAAQHPYRHWLIVALGLLSKILGPIGFAQAIANGRFPLSFAWNVVVNDLIWWVPFALILKGVHDAHLGQKRTMSPEVVRFALRTKTGDGLSLDELSRLSPVLLVFLRHTGCTFCREALSDIAQQRATIEGTGTRMVLVHMDEEDGEVRRFFHKYGLDNVQRISDPNQTLYRAFGLKRGTLWQILGLPVLCRAFRAALLAGHGAGLPKADPFQMPGVFLLYHGTVIRCYRHESAADRPRYAQLVASESLELQS